MSENPIPQPVKKSVRRLQIRKRLFVLIGLLSLVSVSIALYTAIRLRDANTQLTEINAQSRLLLEAVDQARTAQVHFKKQVQEWKDILLRGMDKALYERHTTAFKFEKQAVREAMQHLKALMDQLLISVEPVDTFLAVHDNLNKQYDDALEHFDPDDTQSIFRVDRLVKGIDRDATDRIDAIVAFIREKSQAGIRTQEAFTQAKIARDNLYLQGISALIICSILLGLFFGLTLVRDMKKAK